MAAVENTILIVDDEADIRNLVEGILQDEGYKTAVAANARQAYEAIKNNPPSLIVLDIWLNDSDHDGLEILENVKKLYPFMPVIMISGHGNIETAVNSIQKGAYDFIEKPFKSNRLLLMVQRALEAAALKNENSQLQQSSNSAKVGEILGESPQMLQLKQLLKRVAPSNSRVLITGEAGVGKDMAARYIHEHSERASGPFKTLHCALLQADMIEDALFGNANNGSPGLLEQANKGTLYFDEVSDMPMETQSKILRVFQDHKFEKPNGQIVETDIRVIASTNKDLSGLIDQKKFREDFYYRLNVVSLDVPPLRKIKQDIPMLCDFFLNLYSKNLGVPPMSISKEALFILEAYRWPGNIRQLKNMIEGILIVHSHGNCKTIMPEHLPKDVTENVGGFENYGLSSPASDVSDVLQDKNRFLSSLSRSPLKEAREVFEKEYILMNIERFEGNISKTAQFIGMERSAFHRKLKSLDIVLNDGKVVPANDEEYRKKA